MILIREAGDQQPYLQIGGIGMFEIEFFTDEVPFPGPILLAGAAVDPSSDGSRHA